MAIVFAAKVFGDVLNDTANIYYSDPELNARLGAGEKYFVEARTSGVGGVSPKLTVKLESSNDNVNWIPRNPIITAADISDGATLSGFEVGTDTVGGRFARFTMQLGGTSSPGAYVELWVTARNAF